MLRQDAFFIKNENGQWQVAIAGGWFKGTFSGAIKRISDAGWEVVSLTPFSSSSSNLTDGYMVRAQTGTTHSVVTSYMALVRREGTAEEEAEESNSTENFTQSRSASQSSSGLPPEVEAALAKGEAKRQAEASARLANAEESSADPEVDAALARIEAKLNMEKDR